jgi:uncharacterized protein (TIGR02145 family)
VSPVLLNGETSDTLFIDSNKFALLGLTVPGKVSEFFCLVRNGSQTAVSGSGYAVYGSGAWLANGKWINIAPANLGATESNLADQLNHIPSSAYDKTVYGDWYQWGRKKDGHENRAIEAVGTEQFYKDSVFGVPVDSLDVNGQIQEDKTIYGKFIQRASGTTFDWRDYPDADPNNTITSPADAWTWADATNDPCKDPTSSLPSGFAWRVPSQSEWTQIYQNNTWVWHVGNINGYEIKPGGAARPTSFFLPTAGHRHRNGGNEVSVGSLGCYWSSTVTKTVSYNLYFLADAIAPTSTYTRSFGMSVRCVAD